MLVVVALMRKRLGSKLALTLSLISPAANPQVLTADAELAVSRAAREKGDYNAALLHAQMAVSLSPQMTEAHFTLGSIADDMCIPNAQPGPDERLCGLAIQEYKKVLELDASHADALKNLAYLLYQFYRLEESENYYRQGLALYPDDPEDLCGVAVFDYYHSASDVSKTKAELNLSLKTPLIGSPLCSEVRQSNQARVGEGIALLSRALQFRSDDLDLMGHLSALYYVRAEIQYGNREAYKTDLNAARKLNRMLLNRTRKRRFPLRVLQKCPSAPPPRPDN